MYIAFHAARVKRTLNLSLNHHRAAPSSNRFAFLFLSLSLYLDPPYSLTTWPIHIQLLVTPTNVVYSWKIRRYAGEYFIPRFHSKLGFKTCGSQTEKNFAASSVGWPRGRAWRAKQKLHLSVSTQFYEQCRQ